MLEAITDALWRGQDAPAPEPSEDDAALIVELQQRLADVERGQENLIDAIESADPSMRARLAARSKKLGTEYREIEAEISRVQQRQTTFTAVDEAEKKLWARIANKPRPHDPTFGEMLISQRATKLQERYGLPRMKARRAAAEWGLIMDRFQALDLETQRQIIRQHLRVIVLPGKPASGRILPAAERFRVETVERGGSALV